MHRLFYLLPLLAFISCKKDMPVFVEQGEFFYSNCHSKILIKTSDPTPLYPFNLHRFDIEPEEGSKVLVTYTYAPYAFQECVARPVKLMGIEVKA